MITFEFYRDTYLGSAIPENRFAEVAARAAEELERLKRYYRVEGGEEAQAMAICAMAESFFAHGRHGAGVQSATVGGVSVRYDDATSRAKDLAKKLYQQACVYLEIYRGTENA